MPRADSSSAAVTSQIIESAAAVGWDIMHRCRTHVGIAERSGVDFPNGKTIGWQADSIAHGDLGVAMAYSAADHLDPDGGWDQLAHTHLAEAAQHLQQGPPPALGLFSGTAAVAFALRAHSRSGQRYRRVTASIDALLEAQLDAAIENMDPAGGSVSASYDVVSGLAGAISYTFTTEAGEGKLGERALQAINALAELALVDRPGGLWTPEGKLNESERAQTVVPPSSQLNCGFAHGIAGVLNVLGQACDRGWGSTLVGEATEYLAQVLLAASDLNGTLDVPDALLPHASAGAPRTRSRYAWCYGNLGAALPFHNSTTLSHKHPDIVARLLDISYRTSQDLQLGGPTLCHGRGGKLVLERIMLGEHTVADNAASMLELVNPQRIFLLEDSLGKICIDSPGFLVGSGGAGAALLSLQAPCDAMRFIRILTGTWKA